MTSRSHVANAELVVLAADFVRLHDSATHCLRCHADSTCYERTAARDIMSPAYYILTAPRPTRRGLAVPGMRLGRARSCRVHGTSKHSINGFRWGNNLLVRTWKKNEGKTKTKTMDRLHPLNAREKENDGVQQGVRR